MKPIVTKETGCVRTETVDRVWTYDEIFEIWDREDDTALVPVLANRCIELETENERLRAEVDAWRRSFPTQHVRPGDAYCCTQQESELYGRWG